MKTAIVQSLISSLVRYRQRAHLNAGWATLPLLLALSPAFQILTNAQVVTDNSIHNFEEVVRTERVPIAGGAELITIKARLNGASVSVNAEWIPLVSVLRDTLGDANNENDRLRYVWGLTYTRPTFWQRMAGAVPFLYTRVGSKQKSEGPPPPLMDLSGADHDVWQKICWHALQVILLDPYGTPVRASTRAYQRNISDARKSHIIEALSILALYQELGHEKVFTNAEAQEIQARLMLTDKPFGGLVDELKLEHFYQSQAAKVSGERGHNWELLRQQAETNRLYFEALEMPDGSATHALLWIAKHELQSPQNQRFEGRFLNIKNPWTDPQLQDWQGYSEKWFFDADNRPVSRDTPGAHETEMIPLALYGLDHPKIPALLVDFRDRHNAKRREMSRRVLEDVTKNVLGISGFGDLPYFLGRSLFDFVTGKRGMDVNQPTRLKTYSQLKLLLSLSHSLEPQLRTEIAQRVENVSLNPLENGLEAENRLAQAQYTALLAYAARPDGLPAKLAEDRRAELVKLDHAATTQFFFRMANVLSFGRYTHREPISPDIVPRLDVARQLAYHTRFLRQVSLSAMHSGPGGRSWSSSPRLDVIWNMNEVQRSLLFVAEHGIEANAEAAKATARIFARTDDSETRRVCLSALSQIRDAKARAELLSISENKGLDQVWRDLSAEYLRKGGAPTESLTSSGALIGASPPNQR